MANKEATARIKINQLLEAAGWRFFAAGDAPANIRLEPSVTIKSAKLDALGENFVKPHRRFSIQAKRSEVLFVGYMAEHLTPNGRAAIIVPEGIIFRSQTAYKELRRLLVENSLVAVVSLPAGCFSLYSGMKTSILILDKSLARQSNTIRFFKVENDGFGLGAQRRAIAKNDLPQVQAELAAYLHALRYLPPLATQQPIVAEIEAEQALVAANRELIRRFEQKIQATLARIWGEVESAAPAA